jgi:hypothetical protein
MGLLRTGASALGKLLTVVILGAAFLFGMVGVVYLSLRGEEVKVPEIIGKDVNESEKELAALGLKIKKRASRYSEVKPNTVLEQLPRSGDTVKTGQTILVVVAQENPEGTEAPATVKKDDEVESLTNTEDKPKTSNKNSNAGKKPEKTRDVISNKANKNANTGNSNGNSNSSNSKSDASGAANNKNSSTPANNKSTPPSPSKSPAAKPTVKPAAGNDGDTRNRRSP